jgi:hypothetical protein
MFMQRWKILINFFVASSWEDRDIARRMALQISQKYGWKNVSTWWLHEDRGKKLQYAVEDITNLRKADMLFVYNGEHKTAGKFIEIGIALELRIPVFIYGNKLTTVYENLVVYKGEKFD